MKHTRLILLSSLILTTSIKGKTPILLESQDQHDSCPCSSHRPDGHAPIGVMAAHTHEQGKWMVSYRYMFMHMDGNRIGSNSVSDASVLQDFIATPTDMDMQMHMLSIMYAPTNRLTLMGMVNLVDLSMNHLIGDLPVNPGTGMTSPLAGTTFRTRSSGIGDSSLTALYRFWDGNRQQAHFGLGLLLPTAETDEEDFVPLAGSEIRLPYPMQLGTGSWGIGPSLTYQGQSDNWSWGGQISGRILLDDNDEGYRFGNRISGTVWGARRLNEMFSASLRTNITSVGNISGQDPNIPITNPFGVPIVPTADPSLRGGTRVDLSAGLNFFHPKTGARLAVEVGLPLYQNLDGPQLETDFFLTTGFQLSF